MVHAQSWTGFIAVACFLVFTGVGAIAQVIKLVSRTKHWRSGKLARIEVCEGLYPVRELWSYSAFLLFAMSGLTRSYFDYVLVVGRLPVIILSTIIIWFLYYHVLPRAKLVFIVAMVGNGALLGFLYLALNRFDFRSTPVPSMMDWVLGLVTLFLFYGKLLQSYRMYEEKKSQAVSYFREMGLVLKDITGLVYAVSVGGELYWVGLTHLFSAISSSTICVVKYRLESRVSR